MDNYISFPHNIRGIIYSMIKKLTSYKQILAKKINKLVNFRVIKK